MLSLINQPVHCNVLWPRRDQALEAPKGDLRLGFCHRCGHISNLAFVPALMEYTADYENSLHFSPHFQRYCTDLARRLTGTYDVSGKSVIDIGCGKGDFLAEVCAVGGNRGYGFDPSYSAAQATHRADLTLTFFNEFYSDSHRDIAADLICCRHVLEHIHRPAEFLTGIRRIIGERTGTVVYFEVPNALYILRDLGIWDLIYEHCSYFSPASLEHLFATSGYSVARVGEAYDGQFIGVDCRPNGQQLGGATWPEMIKDLANLVSVFTSRYRTKIMQWQTRLDQLRWEGKRTVVWGGGSKGVTFLNVFKSPAIEFMVDINPRKQGKYVGGTGQEIIAPEKLVEVEPDAVIIMNPVYRPEIEAKLSELGLAPEIMVT